MPSSRSTAPRTFALHPLRLAITLALSASASVALAQATSAPEGGQLRATVVTATGFEQELQQAPASISVVTRQDLETRQFRDLAEALADVEGVDVRGSTGKTGGLSISIRGLPSEYTLILIDGRRQNVAGDVTPNGFGDALGSLIPPISAIERIEVIRGPMSTLYGSDAMGGVVNIITRKVAKEWGGSVNVEAGIPENGDAGKTGKLGFYLNGPIKEDTLGIALRGNLFQRGDSQLQSSSGGGTISARGPSPAETDQHTLGARLTLTPNRSNDVWLDVDQARTAYNNERCQLGTLDYVDCATGAPTASASGYADTLRFNRDQIAVGHTGRFGWGKLESSLMRNTTETVGRTLPSTARPLGDPSIGTPRQLEATSTLLDSKALVPLTDNQLLTLGGQVWNAKLVDSLVPSPYTQDMWSLFAEHEWRIVPTLALTTGLRRDQHDAFGSQLSPRGYLVWNATEAVTIKGGVSRGFKAPGLNQLVDGISGVSGQGRTLNIGNPALKPEISTSTELGALFDGGGGLTAGATLFHNRIKDRITGGAGDCAVNPIPTCSFNPTATYAVNRDEAKTWGLELTTRVPLAQRWSLNMNYTWTDSELIEDGRNVGKLGDTAKHVANAALRWDASDKWSAWLRAEYRGKSRRFDGDPAALTGNNLLEQNALGDLRGYALLHAGGQYRVSKSLTLNANIFNLLDKDFLKFQTWNDTTGATQWGSPYFKSAQSTRGGVPSGRTLWLSANMTF